MNDQSRTPITDAWCELAMSADITDVLDLAKCNEIMFHESEARCKTLQEELAQVKAELSYQLNDTEYSKRLARQDAENENLRERLEDSLLREAQMHEVRQIK